MVLNPFPKIVPLLFPQVPTSDREVFGWSESDVTPALGMPQVGRHVGEALARCWNHTHR